MTDAAQTILCDALVEASPPGLPSAAGAGDVPADRPPVPVPYDAVVANPPYQLATEGTSDRPIYPHMMDLAYAVAPVASLVTPARFLFDAGKTPKAWNRKMLSDPHLSVALYEPDSPSVFPGTEIMGGVAVTVRDETGGLGPIGDFCPIPELDSIRRKIWEVETGSLSMDDIMFAQGRLDLSRLYATHPECRAMVGSGGRESRLTTSILSKLPIFSEQPDEGHGTAVLGLVGGRRATRYVSEDLLLATRRSNMRGWKVAAPASNGSAPVGRDTRTSVIGVPQVLGPGSTHTQSFVSFGDFACEAEARACMAYVRTRLARALLGILKATQHNHRGTWRLVPLQDFTEVSDIDWDAPVDGVDGQLAERYGLDDAEQDFLRDAIRPLPEGQPTAPETRRYKT